MSEVRHTRNVGILIYDDVEVLDFTGPFQVFLAGSNKGKDFNVFTLAEQKRPIITLGNLSVNPSYSIFDCPKLDILIIPGGWGARKEMQNETITQWISKVSNEVELLLSVCTGALILAKANLLDGLVVTTYKRAILELKEIASKSTEIIENVRYTDNGHIIFSAGVSAGIDMSLYALSKLYGRERALATAEMMEYDWRE